SLDFDKPVSGEITSRSGINFNDGSHHQLSPDQAGRQGAGRSISTSRSPARSPRAAASTSTTAAITSSHQIK
ncbi:hypothetical protein C7E18_24215, partial [Stenotrophomonas maltophilia]